MRRSVCISRPDPSVPWGFRIQGGRDFGQQLRIALVTAGSLADRNGLEAGDLLVSIGGDSTASMTHQQAQQAVIRCCNQLELEVVQYAPNQNVSETSRTQTVWTASGTESPITQSTVNINLHKPSPASPWPSGLNSRPNDGNRFSELDNYAPKPFIPISAKQEKTYVPAVNKTISYNKPTSPVGSTRFSFNSTAKPSSSSLTNPSSLNGAGAGTGARPAGVREAKLQSPGSVRRPVCHYCKSPIQGPFVDTSDYCFCPEHFFCFTCRAPLNNRYFAEEDGKFYCQEDFVQHVASRCAKCGGPIIGAITKALDKSWHPDCFVCCYCKCPLRDKFYVEDADQVLCEEHWRQLHLTECAKCKQSISEIDRFIEAFGKQFHAKCFCCAACQCPLEGKPFHSRDNKPFCRAHANAAAIFG